MPNLLQQFQLQLDPIVKEFQSSLDGLNYANFSLDQIPGFPFQIYQSNMKRYAELMSWFTGEALMPEAGSEQEDFPIRINPLNGTCLKHAYALFGEVQDDGRPLIVTKLVPEPMSDKEMRKTARDSARSAENVINRIWWENFGRPLMMRNGLTSQIFGGSVMHLRYVPWQNKMRTVPIQIERISPEQFIGFPETGDEYRLRESWIVKSISPQDAASFGVSVGPQQRKVYWIEHWTPDMYQITINGKVIQWKANGVTVPGEGENVFGFVPSVYIPHIRAGSFYGESQISQLIGLVKEINLRWGDTGDAHNADTHSYIAIRNVQGSPHVIRVTPSLEALDLGSADSLAGDKHEPDAFEIKKASVTDAHIKYMQLLMDQYRRDANQPKVSDGEDEGSQRSASTLVARMWPLVSHINTERIFWSGGMDWLSSMMLRMCADKGVPNITQEHILMRTRQVFAPVLPKDREVFVNELVARAANNLGSPNHLIELTGDVEDVEEELDLIKEFMTFEAETKAKEQPLFGAPGGSPQGGSSSQPGQMMRRPAQSSKP